MRLAWLTFALVGVAACNGKPAKDSSTPPVTTATVSATPSSSDTLPPSVEDDARSPASAAENPIGAKCKVDTECELFSSYCSEAPCQCFAIGRGGGAPKCKSDRPVNCLVDPCQQKVAKCKDGACATVPKNDR